jgi:hypothetical protein
MSSARVSIRAIKALTSTSKITTRPLSITGATTFSSILTSDKPPVSRSNAPRLPASATLPIPDANDTGAPARHFNTSRSLKAVKDSSTIDFAYIPDFDPELSVTSEHLRVPILPFTQASEAAKAKFTEADTPVSYLRIKCGNIVLVFTDDTVVGYGSDHQYRSRRRHSYPCSFRHVRHDG